MSRFVILMYHMVCVPESAAEVKYACPPRRFARHMGYLRRSGLPLVTLGNIDRTLAGEGEIPDGAVAVTFDDGLQNLYDHALPILRRFQIPATLFLTSGLVGEVNRWMGGGDYPERRMLTWPQVAELAAAGVAIGGHSRTHPRLTEVDRTAAWEEIAAGREEIAARLGVDVPHFAYPYGVFDDEVRAAVERAGYRLACSTRAGFNRPDIDPFALRRIEVFGSDPVWRLAQKIRFGTNESGIGLPLRYYSQRLAARLRGRGVSPDERR